MYIAVILFGHFYSLIWESFPIQKWPLFSQFHDFSTYFPNFDKIFPKCEGKGSFLKSKLKSLYCSDFILDFRKLPFPSYLGNYFNKIGKISAKIHEIGKTKAIFGLGMTPI